MGFKRVDIKTGFLCNNNCRFCVQAHKKRFGNRPTIDIKKDLEEARKNKCSGVVFTGGESTIRDDILELIIYAKNLGFKIIQLQTNARMLSYKKFCKKLIKAGVNEFSPAIHGHTAELHDYLTRSKESFNQTVKAIKNLRELDQCIMTNTVVVKPNYKHLPELARLLVKLNVDQFQFAFMHAVGNAYTYFGQMMPKVSLAAPYIKKGLQIGIDDGIKVMAEAMPFCTMQGYEKYCSEFYMPETEIRDINSFDPSFEKTRKEYGKIKFPPCKECKFDPICEGPWKEYPERKGDEEFKPIKDYTELMEGSGFFGDYKGWNRARGLYLKLIKKPGKILDLGCGNGFLLYFIREKTKLNLIPFGVELNKKLTKEAKKLFPKYSSNFITQDINNFQTKEKFDYIIVYFPFFKGKNWLRELYNMLGAGGRVILSLYDDKANEFNTFEEKIKEIGFLPSGSIEEKNITKLIWIDKN